MIHMHFFYSGIPTRRGSISVKKMNSTSSTATTASVSSPDRSLTASPTKSRSSVSMNNNSTVLAASPSSNSNFNLTKILTCIFLLVKNLKQLKKHLFNCIYNFQKRLIHVKKWTIMLNKMNYWLILKRFNHIDVINTGGEKL